MNTLPVALASNFPALRPFIAQSSQSNIPLAPASYIFREAVSGWAHLFNMPPHDHGRPARAIWMPAFLLSMLSPDWDVAWLRMAGHSLQRVGATPEVMAALERLETTGFQRQFAGAFAEELERVS